MTINAPKTNINALVLPSFKLIFAAVILINPGGKIPMVAVIKPSNIGKIIVKIYLILNLIKVIALFTAKY